MDPLVQVAAVARKIEDLIKSRIALQYKVCKGTISDEEQVELNGIDELLKCLKNERKFYEKLFLEDKLPAATSFSKADEDWIKSVTGVNTSYREWTGFVIDQNIQPRPGFKTSFEEVAKVFHQRTEASRRIFLNLFLSDIILRDEFDGTLRVFPELEVPVVEKNGQKKRQLISIMDYAVGFGKGEDIFDKKFPSEICLVAVEATTSFSIDDLWHCVAQAASLYKMRMDSGKVRKSVWGVLTNASIWQFIFIDDDGLLWQSDDYDMTLRSFDESEVLHVYRILHYIVKCCYDAITSPSSSSSPNECNAI